MDELRVCVVGLGKVGLPIAARFALSGARVTGCDIDAARVDVINRGVNPIPNEGGLDEAVRDTVAAGTLRASTDTTAAVAASDYVIVIVPLLAHDDGSLGFGALEAAADAIADGAHDGLTVIFETTLPVGSTRRLVGRIAERSGLTLGETLFGAFSPERVYSGRILADLANYPKIVGGLDQAGGAKARAFYERMLPGVEILQAPAAEEAEFAKLAETTYRDVNIALANEFARYAAERDLDALASIRMANTQPFSHIHAPGAGVGGHCIPHYPRFVLHDMPGLPLISLSRRINDEQPAWIVRALEKQVGDLAGASVVLLGVSYREDVKELTSSPGVDLLRLLGPATKRLAATDPYFDDAEIRALGAEPVALSDIEGFDVVLLHAPHQEFGDVVTHMRAGQVLFDTRNAVDPDEVTAAGVTYMGVGRPTKEAR